MNLTFPEILDENFENKIKEIKNKVKKAFKKNRNNISNAIEKNPIRSTLLFISALSIPFLLGINHAFVFIFSLLFFMGFLFFAMTIMGNNNIEKNRTTIKNIANYYDNKNKKTNSKEVKKMISKLNKKEQELLYIINSKDIIKKKDLKIKNEVLKSKIKESSILEIEKYESLILNYLEKLEDKKQVKEIKTLLNSRLKEKEKENSLFIEKEIESKMVVNI
tara:strand:+ start:38428 stop:39087 length:660 start_codon:yes stop_codon:yes gene_type:complete